jgi:nicotinamidase-related amidase
MHSKRRKNQDLHGNVPDSCPVVLLLVDVINGLDFPDNSALLKAAPILGSNIAALKKRCKEVRIPVIYVNDNRDKWRSDFSAVLTHCRQAAAPAQSLVEKLLPDAADYVVLKPKHSAFYATPLDTLLAYLNAHTVILTGLTTSACILMTAGEIYVRDLKLYVPSDCVAALRRKDHQDALDIMRKSFEADTTPSAKLDLRKLLRAKPA